MQLALTISRANLGQTAPNPCVGCVIVYGNRIIGRGVTSRGGRPHAEAIAIENACSMRCLTPTLNPSPKGEGNFIGATMYVTLEPCAHLGKTPPCVDAIIASGIRRVVIATTDPDPRVAGQGIARLKQAGIEVVVGVCAEQANEIHAGFFKTIKTKRPSVTLKLATTRNGYMYFPDQKWITSQAARDHGHLLRAEHDAILVGIGTVLADDPMLNCRLWGMEHRSPLRVILDSQLRIPINSKIAQSAKQYKTVIATKSKDEDKIRMLENLGIEIFAVGEFEDILRQLYEKWGVTRLMVEGGFKVAQTVLSGGFADRIYWYRSNSTASPQAASLNAFDLKPYLLDYFADGVTYFASDELRVYKNISMSF